VKVIRKDSFTFVRDQSILCIVYSATSIAAYGLGVSNVYEKGDTVVVFGYFIGFFTVYSIFLIYWNISL
jgi:hypothetical protein